MSRVHCLRLKLLLIFTSAVSCGKPTSTLSSETLALSSDTHACYPLDRFELCVPHPNKGDILVARSSLNPPELTKAVLEFTGRQSDLVATTISDQIYDVTALFPEFIASKFNSLVNFSGPNCYNTALLASGGIESRRLRYYSQEEFDQILATEYTEVDEGQAKMGDVLVYDAKNSREHVALYLGHGLIFHKKGVMKGYGYRITAVEKAYDFEPGEWEESPLALKLLPADTAIVKAPRAFYRLKQKQKSESATPIENLVNTIEEALLSAGPMWGVPRDMGILSEGITTDLIRILADVIDPLHDNKSMIKSRLTSLRDQIFLSIDETLFQTPRGTVHRDDIRHEFCYKPESDFMHDIVASLADIYRPDHKLTVAESDSIFATIAGHDRVNCNAPVTAIVKAQVLKH